MPSTPVIRPPVRKLTSRGAALEKSYAGLTVFAATFTDSVATTTVNRPRATTSGFSNLAASWIGSQIASP